ncbi:MAG TPA: hypothetical protein VFI13_07145 [Gemmatimonadales bacterium]|nr:hypothetical protein [Gemmatimonadales bacterium]
MRPIDAVLRPRLVALLLAGVALAACSPTYVVVPQPRDGYSARDTLHGRLKGKDVRVTFHFDTTWRVDTVTRWRTVYREGSRVDTLVVVEAGQPDGRPGPGGRRRVSRVDTVLVVVHDTVRVFEPRRPGSRVDTVRVVVRDTARVGSFGRPGSRVDTVRVVVHDTVRVAEQGRPGRPGLPGGPGGPVVMPPPPNLGHVDTVRVVVHDTVRVNVRDTVRIVVHDTVRVEGHGGGEGGGGGDQRPHPRTTQIPPGQYPPSGQCRLWIVGTPPGRQARPAACNALGNIPTGAFILFAGKAWDADYDWTRDPDAAHVPPEILAISRQRHH